MRQTATVTAFIAGLALLAGCGGDNEPAETSPPPAEVPATDEASGADQPTDTAAQDDTPSQVEEPQAAETDAGSPQFADFPAPYAAADYDQGKRIFNQCKTCHTLDEGGMTVLGPNLYGIFGREVGTKEGFGYSTALQEADFTWTPDQLDQWLTNPRAFLPGNNMSFSGVRRPDDRAAVIAYIMAETGYEPS